MAFNGRFLFAVFEDVLTVSKKLQIQRRDKAKVYPQVNDKRKGAKQ